VSNGAEKDLPSGWAAATVGDVVSPRTGKADPQATPTAKFIGMEQVEPHTMRLLGTVPASSMKSSANTFQRGDVLYGRLRAYLNKVYQPDFAGLCSGEFIVLPETCAAHGRFLKYRLNAGDFVRFASHINTGDRPRVDWDQIKSFMINLPPRPEQERVADALDELLSDLDAGVAALEGVRAKMKRYRAAVLNAAVEGALTAGWRRQYPDAEPATEFLSRVLAARRRRWEDAQLKKFAEAGRHPPKDWKAKYRAPAAPATANRPPLPRGWCWANVGQLADVGTGATPDRGKRDIYYLGGTIPWVTSGCVNAPRVLEPSEFVTPKALSDCNLTIYPAGTLLLAMYGEGRTRGMCSELGIACATNQALAAIEVSEELRDYLRAFLTKNYDDTRKAAVGGVQPNLNLVLVRSIVLPLPPLAEQAAIVEAVDAELSVTAHLENDLGARLISGQALRQSLLSEAFAGRLVPQDPSDEPASELLKRIVAERERRAQPRRAASLARPRPRPARARAAKI
jgi:type I restriction enzyme S subunit